MDRAAAHAAAQAFVESLDTWFSDPTDSPAIQPDATVELEFGWVVHWNSRRFLETGDVRHALHGNTPLLVDRRDGAVHAIGTGWPIQQAIRGFADAWRRAGVGPVAGGEARI
jgi:hypothetical protein